jgi:hypothetical protein
MEKFIATVKLITNEEILGTILKLEEGILIENPLIIEELFYSNTDLETNIRTKAVEITKWIKSSTDDTFFISMDKIITVGELKSPILELYKKALKNFNENKFKNNSKQSYDGTRINTKEARVKFENLFKNY